MLSSRFRKLVVIFIAVCYLGIVNFTPTYAMNGTERLLWYQDNNMGVAGGFPTDFKQKFLDPSVWSESLKYLDVYLMRTNLFNNEALNLSDNFLSNYLLPTLKSYGIELAFDTGAATWIECRNKEAQVAGDLENIAKIIRNGGKVSYISLQSVLSKPLPDTLTAACPTYTMDDRIRGVIYYIKEIKAVYPDIKFGIIDALPTHGEDYVTAYRTLVTRMANHGLTLSYIHLDHAYDEGHPAYTDFFWTDIKELERYVTQDLNIPFGVIYASRPAGETSNQAFHERLISQYGGYKSIGGDPDHYLVMAWYPYPDRSTPESIDYTHTNTLRAFGRRLTSHFAKPTNSPAPTTAATPTSSPTPVPSADANSDGRIDGKDYVVWINNYQTNTTLGSSRGDFNRDGYVDGRDYVVWLNSYLQ